MIPQCYRCFGDVDVSTCSSCGRLVCEECTWMCLLCGHMCCVDCADSHWEDHYESERSMECE